MLKKKKTSKQKSNDQKTAQVRITEVACPGSNMKILKWQVVHRGRRAGTLDHKGKSQNNEKSCSVKGRFLTVKDLGFQSQF